MASVIPTASELDDLALACNKLWDLDANRLEPGVHYELDLQEGKTSWQRGDVAHDPLFVFVDQSVFERRTFQLFYKLLDNYERSVGVTEVVTREEVQENHDFINAVADSAPMRYAFNWLVKKKKFSGDMSAFKNKLHDIWFGLYRRQERNDSSGFEHVFIGEERDGKIMGCHNWIQLYNEERHGRLNYMGYIRPKQRGRSVMKPHNMEQVITIQFMWDHEVKPVSTSLIGVSPEFEVALFTLCFLNGNEDNNVRLGPYRCNIKCFTFGRGSNVKIGTAFPEALPLTPEQAATMIQAIQRGRIVRQNKGRPQPAPTPTTTTVRARDPANPWGQPPPAAATASANPPAESSVPAPAPAPTAAGAWGKPPKI